MVTWARVRPLMFEVALLLGLFAVYKLGRVLVDGRTGAALANADRIWEAERAIGLPDERALQEWVLGWDPAAWLANCYYVGLHFPVTAALLVWLWVRHRRHYRRVRNELVALTAAGMAVHMYVPLAPPRLADLGMVDTMLAVGPSAYPETADGIANQYAAMPSLHVGWALVVALAVLRVSRSRWRYAVAMHAPVTMLVVVVTANHYWLDGLVAAALLGVLCWIALFAPALRLPVPAPRVPARTAVPVRALPVQAAPTMPAKPLPVFTEVCGTPRPRRVSAGV